ncbi:hypothetical protein TSAR_006083, partial [Trichomalopsis sarcophagae]
MLFKGLLRWRLPAATLSVHRAAAPAAAPTINKTMDVLNQAEKNPNVKKVTTRFGMKIVLQLDSVFDVFLPTRAILVEKEEAYNNFKEDTKEREPPSLARESSTAERLTGGDASTQDSPDSHYRNLLGAYRLSNLVGFRELIRTK